MPGAQTREENAADLAREEERRNSLLPVYVVAEGKASEKDDEGVPGVYLAEVEPELSDEEKAEVALDHFHENIGISMLDDFDITVFDAAGNLLPRMEDYDPGSMQTRGEWCGGLNDSDVPAAVAAGIAAYRAPTP